MEIRTAVKEDLEILLEIYRIAQAFMVSNGNPNQWKPGYPGREQLEKEIEEGVCRVCVQEGEIEGAFTYREGKDPTYARIDNGAWLNQEPYGVVHRLASRGRVRHIADFCLDWAFAQCKNLRIDTHRDNVVMQHILTAKGFQVCGTIYVADGSPRIAFQKAERSVR